MREDAGPARNGSLGAVYLRRYRVAGYVARSPRFKGAFTRAKPRSLTPSGRSRHLHVARTTIPMGYCLRPALSRSCLAAVFLPAGNEAVEDVPHRALEVVNVVLAVAHVSLLTYAVRSGRTV